MKKILKHFKKNWYRYGLETLVVIVGVLIAFGLNSWNESRKNQKLKETYLDEMTLDVQRDIRNLSEWNKGNDMAEEEGLYLLAFLENNLLEIDSQRLVQTFLMSQYKPVITISSSTYNDLVNSGNIKIFEELKFKNLLDEYYTPSNWLLKLDDRITQTIWYDYRDKMSEFVDPTIFKLMYQQLETGSIENLDLLNHEIKWDSIKNSDELKRELKNVLAFREVIRETYLRSYNQKAESLLESINQITN
jgi:uncharacterized protein YnzC (UPF0291/DUF896 family)